MGGNARRRSNATIFVLVAALVGPASSTSPSATGSVFSVLSFGAVGDGTVDDTSAIQAAISAAARVGGTVTVPSGAYRITKALTVPANTTVTGSGEIRQVTAATYGFRITGDDVTIDGLTLTGRHSTPTYSGSEYAIFAQGVSVSTPLRRLSIRNVTMSKWGDYGVHLRWAVGFNVIGCNIFDIGYAGIGVLTASEGLIADNRVDNITPGTATNMYGIFMSYSGDDASSSDIIVRGNTVSRVAWEAIDTHGGSRLTIDNNRILSSGIAIAMVNGNSPSRTSQDLVITNNFVDGEQDAVRLDKGFGVIVQGYVDGAGVITPASATITGNTFKRTSDGLYLIRTNGVVVSGNSFERTNRTGVLLNGYNTNFKVTQNTFIDVWSNTSWVAGIETDQPGNSGMISGNTLTTGTKVATYLNQYGYYYSSGLTGITVGTNNFTAATAQPVAGRA